MKISGKFDVVIQRLGQKPYLAKTHNTFTKRGAMHFLQFGITNNIPWTLGGELADWINIWWCYLRWIDVDNFVTLHRDDAISYIEYPGVIRQTDNRQWQDDGDLGILNWDEVVGWSWPSPSTTALTMTKSWRSSEVKSYKGLWLEYERQEGTPPNYEFCHAVITEAIFDPTLEIHNNDIVTVRYTLSKI